MERILYSAVVFTALFGFTQMINAEVLSIYDIQYTTDPAGASLYDGSVVNCTGGIVIHIRPGPPAKLTLYDPNHPDEWGGIMAKDPEGVGVFTDVNVGDWVSFYNFEVEDYRGTTFLQYYEENDPCYTIISRDNPLPVPLTVQVGQIKAPVEGEMEWVVEDHSAEKYEAMFLKVIDVNVGGKDYGKAQDNYILQSNREPNSCWASDYMNEDTGGYKYHPLVQTGQRFCSVTGILEQYTGTKYSVFYDYYQLLTTSINDFTITQTADCDGDCDVDLADFSVFGFYWQQNDCNEPSWCDGADLTENGNVDMADLTELCNYWLWGTE
jgi:hypothetical protein